MGVLTDLAGVGALGSKAQDAVSGKKRNSKRADQSSPFDPVPGSSSSDIDVADTDDTKRPNGKRSNGKSRA